MASSSTSSSPLFEQPFAEMNFYTPGGENGRLRRRENESFVNTSAARHNSDEQPLFSSQQSQPHYYTHSTRRRSNNGNMNSVDRWVPRLFKMILWSPVIVVALWMSSAVLFTRRIPTARGATVQVRPKAGKQQAQRKQQHHHERGESIKEGFVTGVEVLESALGKEQPRGMLPVIAPLGQAQSPPKRGDRFTNFVQGLVQGRPKEQKSIIVQPANLRPPLGAAFQQPHQEGMYPQQAVQAQAPAMQADGGVYLQQGGTGNYPNQQQQPAMQYDGVYLQQGQNGNYPNQQQQPAMQYDGVYLQQGQSGNYPNQQQQQPAMQYDGVYLQQGQNGNYPNQQQQPAMQYEGVYMREGTGNYPNQQQQQPAMQYDGIYMQNGGTGNYPQQQQQQQQGQPAMQYDGIYMQNGGTGNYPQQQGQPAMQYEGIYMQNGGTGNYPQQQQEQPAMGATGKASHLRGSTQYLYYNPNDVVVVNGQVYLPSQAYDKNGKPHDLTNTKAQVFIQPPPLYGVHHFNHSNVTDSSYTYVHPNTVKTPVYGHHSGDKEEQTAKGIAMPNLNSVEGNSSSILVATVGVVALLVGALSARHARGRACLNACLENETLASEAAYDTAHTRANTYSTFWKGDLEKFDV